jgi:hypothetical protein
MFFLLITPIFLLSCRLFYLFRFYCWRWGTHGTLSQSIAHFFFFFHSLSLSLFILSLSFSSIRSADKQNSLSKIKVATMEETVIGVILAVGRAGIVATIAVALAGATVRDSPSLLRRRMMMALLSLKEEVRGLLPLLLLALPRNRPSQSSVLSRRPK